MKTSINEQLRLNHTDIAETVYLTNQEQVNRYPVMAGDFFSLTDGEEWSENSWVRMHYLELTGQKKDESYQKLDRKREKIKAEIRKIKESDPRGCEHREQLSELGREKKELTKELERLQALYREEAGKELQKELGVQGTKLFSYKNTVSMGSFEDLERQMPKFSELDLPWFRKCPLFFGSMKKIREALDETVPIGLVGGPCLFGTFEIEIRVSHRDGQIFSYDFNTGRHYDRKGVEGQDFSEHVEQNFREIERISFRNWKKGVTSQEYDSLEVLFAFGALLGAKVAIPIPDISYQKYLANVLEPLEENLKADIMEAFRTETRKIADMYLETIEKLKKQYPSVEVKALHERDEALCRQFHERRKPYFESSSLIQRITARKKKTDAILDYISMLALPFYFWGTPQVIQIDSLDEADSYRKCKKVHKGAFSLSAILYPERLSANGKDTIFNAPLEYKEYLI